MSDKMKQRIEDAYEREERPISGEAGVDCAGQMTVAFCDHHSSLCCALSPPDA